ncbi:MAG: nuclear transport factor 2 family protein [bacterium]
MSDDGLQRYVTFFEQLNADNLSQFSTVMSEDVHFVDPFNDVHGLAAVDRIFRHMFDSLEEIKFTVSHAAVTVGPEPRGLIRWELSSQLNGKPYDIVGMSEIGFADDGRVNLHIDYWDSGRQFYERLPVISWLLRTIRSRLAA